MCSISKLKDLLSEANLLVEDIEAKALSDSKKVLTELGDLPYKVIHFSDNPFARCIKSKQKEYESLRRDHERLRARLSLVETGNNVDVTLRIEEAVNSSDQIATLTRKVAELKEREDKILNSFKKTSREFREVCYLLTGYRIDPLKDEIVRLSHMYAEKEEDRLFFEVKTDGTISLLQNEYANQYSEFISTYLEEADSFPAFLAAITLDLFKAASHSPITKSETFHATLRSVIMSSISKLKDLLSEANSLVKEIESKGPTGSEDLFTDLGDLPYKVIHFSNNPFARCIIKEQEEYEYLRRDYERLRARLSLVESGNNVDVTLRIDEAVDNAQQIERLKREIAEYKSREEKISSSLRKTASDFRQVCLSLIGWRVDALKNNIYRLTHQNVTNEEDKLFFEVKRDGTIVLLKNDYSRRYSEYVSTYVDQGESLPALLAAINLDVFKSQGMNSTQSVDMSISMSTTVLPNPNYGRRR